MVLRSELIGFTNFKASETPPNRSAYFPGKNEKVTASVIPRVANTRRANARCS